MSKKTIPLLFCFLFLLLPTYFFSSTVDYEKKYKKDLITYIEKSVSNHYWKSNNRHMATQIPFKILAINDFHGQLTGGKMVSSQPAGNAAVLTSYLKNAMANNKKSTIIIEAGDLVGASPPVSALLQDEPAIMVFNYLGNKYTHYKNKFHPLNNLVGIPGNHEFDEGKDELLRLINGGNYKNGPFLQSPYRGANFPYVCANIIDSKTNLPLLKPFVIKMINNIPTAYIGAIIKDTPSIVTASGIEGLEFQDEVISINEYVKMLKNFGIHAIVVIIHNGGQQISYSGTTDSAEPDVTGPIVDIIKNLDDDVDLVITGHSHSFTNAMIPTINGKEILVTQAYSSGTAYADIDLTVDCITNDIIGKSARIITTWANQGPGLTPDRTVANLVAKAQKKVDPLISQIIGKTENEILRQQNTDGESALGNLIADSQRIKMETDFAFMNPGGIRENLPKGDITWGMLYTVQPFNNYLVKMELTGQQIYDLLNQQWVNPASPKMLQISGLTYTWDNNLPADQKVIEIRDKYNVTINLAAKYTVTVNNFLAGGGDNFTVLKQGQNQLIGGIDLDAFIEYIQSLPQPFSVTIEERITRNN